MLPPTCALLCTNDMFDFRLRPLVNSFTRFNKNGVIFAPSIFCYYDYFIACPIALSIYSPYAGLLLGTAINNPFYNPNC